MLINLDRGLFTLETVLKEPLPPIDWDVEPLIAHGNRVVVYVWGVRVWEVMGVTGSGVCART
jgi:hypothetical protein